MMVEPAACANMSAGRLSPFLHGKHAWERGDADAALCHLERILAEPERSTVLYVPPSLVDPDHTAMRFEDLVAILVSTDEFLLVRFAPVIKRLWKTFPAQYIFRCLDRRQADAGDLDEDALDVVYDAAAAGLLSFDQEDYGLVAKVVFSPDDCSRLAQRIDIAKLEALVAAATQRESWSAFVEVNAELVTSLFLYTVFHKARRMDANMVLDGLDRVIERQPKVIEVTAGTFARWFNSERDLTEVVRVGLRSENGSPTCVETLVAAIESREFETFAATCLD